SLCEDIAIGAGGAVFVTDPFTGAIDTIAAPVTASSIAVEWTHGDALLADSSIPVPPFGAHGLVVVGSDLYVDNFSTSGFYRIPIGSDGTAGAIVAQSASITNPEHLYALDATHLLVSEDGWC